MFVVASPVDADAPLASARDTPAIPNVGKVLLRRLLFGERFDMAQFSRPFGHIGTNRHRYATPRIDAGASVKKVIKCLHRMLDPNDCSAASRHRGPSMSNRRASWCAITTGSSCLCLFRGRAGAAISGQAAQQT
jgi:hypothetical protein